jgi:hypothetical protein
MGAKHRFAHRRSASSRIGSVLLHSLMWLAISASFADPRAAAFGRAAPDAIVDAPSPLPSVQLESTAVEVTPSAADTSASWDGRHPEAGSFDLPVVYLNRNGQAAAEAERMLTVSTPAVTLRAASGATIPFGTQNGKVVEGVPSQALDLPYLVLYRNGALTRAGERTLILEVTGIGAPVPGVTVTLEIETQHVDPNFSGEAGQRLSVWRESRWIARPMTASQTGVTAVFALEFGATVPSDTGNAATPTDYFRYEVMVTDANHPPTDPLYTLSEDDAFLMESQWVARLPEVREESPGAAPDELIVYYCDMFPFRKDRKDPTTWLPREDVTAYVGTELLPQMVEAFRVQTDEWGFPWTPAWISYRPEDAERLSVALGDGRTWFHGWAPDRGHSGISINVSRGTDAAAYDSLTDGLMSNFHHELFHNLQRNLNLNLGRDGRVDGAEDTWQFFTEGTAVLASSVGQPSIQFAPSLPRRAYMRYVNASVLWDVGRFRDLIVNDQEKDPYSAAIYWRFLYEQCGGMHEGVGDTATGMQIIRRALTALYSGTVDLNSPADLVQATSEVLDRALAGSSCPFQTYGESLTAFAHAIYTLRLEGGRCTEPGTPAGCSLYDPHHLYRAPHFQTIPFAGTARAYRHDLPGSLGSAFVDVILDPATDGQALTLELYVPPALAAEVHVQILQLAGSGEDARSQHALVRSVGTEVPAQVGPDGRLTYVIPQIRTAACNRLGLILTRLDTQEASDPIGQYTILLQPGVSHWPEAVDDVM